MSENPGHQHFSSCKLFKRQHNKMIKHTQTIRQQKPTNCLSAFDHLVGLAPKGLNSFRAASQSFLIFLASRFELLFHNTWN